MKKLGITIRMNAGENTLTTSDGIVFDRSALPRDERSHLRHLIVEAFRKARA